MATPKSYLDWKTDTWSYLVKLSHTLSGGAELGGSVTGHTSVSVNGTTGAFIFLGLIFLFLSTAYLAFRVYKQDKKLTPKLEKELGLEEEEDV